MSDIREHVDVEMPRSAQLENAAAFFAHNSDIEGYNRGFEDLSKRDIKCCKKIGRLMEKNPVVKECIEKFGLTKLVDKMLALADNVQGVVPENRLDWIHVENAAQELIQECEEERQGQAK